MMSRVRAVFVVLNDKGLHTRPSTELVKCAAHFNAQNQPSSRGYVVNAQTPLGIFLFAACRGGQVGKGASGEGPKKGVPPHPRLTKNSIHRPFLPLWGGWFFRIEVSCAL